MPNDYPAPKKLRWAYLPECDALASGWSAVRFTDVCDVIAGQSPPSETYNEKGQGLPFLQGNGDFSHKYPIPKSWCTAPVKVAEVDDTLISVRAPVGEVNRADRQYVIGRGLAAVRAVSANPDFIYHGLQRWRWSLQRVAQGTTFDAVTARHFSQLLVALPDDTHEQTAIARVLDAVDVTIDRTREAESSTKELQLAIVQHFFYSALGVTAYADHPAQRLPAGWQLLPTEALLAEEPKNGISPQATAQPPGVPTFSIAAVRDGKVDLSNASNLKYAKVSDRIAEKFRINTGDVLVVRGNANPDLVGKAGRVGDFPKRCIYPDITKRIVFRRDGEKPVLPGYAVLAWNHPIIHNQVLRRAKTSNGTLKINNRDVKQIVMPVPPETAQEEIVNLVAAVDSKLVALNQKIEALHQIKRSLMQDLLTGAVRVNPALFPSEAAA
jgi:type I restriction enzyme, S subunit